MRFGSLFSGVGGFDLGLERAGMQVVFQCEQDAYRRRVLARHWPAVPRFEDVREVAIHQREDGGHDNEELREAAGFVGHESWTPKSLDLLCGGFPCQDLSVAGRRKGLAGERSGLFFEFARIADELVRPGGYVLIENVPGLLSSANGRDFAVLLSTLAELGFHDLAWRVLDSRYFGVPQRRRRVYILGRRASGRVCAEVLLESEGGQGDSQTGDEAREGVAEGATGSVVGALDTARGGPDDNSAQAGHLIANTLRASTGTGGGGQKDWNVVCAPADPNGVRETTGLPGRMDCPVSVAENQRGELTETDYAKQLTTGGGKPGQGYPTVRHGALPPTDAVPFDPKPDGPRYAAMGDAVTVNVLEWIGRRILAHPENA